MSSEEKCAGCEEDLNPEVDYAQFSSVTDEWFCEGCWESDIGHATTLYWVVDGKVSKFTIGDYFRINEYGDEIDPKELPVRREYISTDGWRGYNNTTIEGTVEVLTGWTTGGWDDSTGQRKKLFNEWAESLLKGEITPPFDIFVVLDPTSNVFSTAVSILVKVDKEDEFTKWFEEDIDDLHHSLG